MIRDLLSAVMRYIFGGCGFDGPSVGSACEICVRFLWNL